MSQEVHPKQKLHKYEGILELYFETGMECMGTIFHDNRGNHEGLHWDQKNKPGEKMIYRSLAWSIWFGNRAGMYNIRIFNKRNKVVYEGPLTKDKKKMKAEKYRFAYLPKELTVKQWVRFCQKEYRAELWTNELTTALKEQHKLEHDVGDIVYDDLNNKDVVVLNVTFGENNTIGYWVNSDYLEGGRHPWEISKINWSDRWKQEREKEEKKDENSNG